MNANTAIVCVVVTFFALCGWALFISSNKEAMTKCQETHSFDTCHGMIYR